MNARYPGRAGAVLVGFGDHAAAAGDEPGHDGPGELGGSSEDEH